MNMDRWNRVNSLIEVLVKAESIADMIRVDGVELRHLSTNDTAHPNEAAMQTTIDELRELRKLAAAIAEREATQ